MKNSLLARPRPPADLITVGGLVAPGRFVPAPDLLEWIRSSYLHEDGGLFTEEHAHLDLATIGCLWTNVENIYRQRRMFGVAEMPTQTIGRGGKWMRARGMQQLTEWFGEVPDFLLTFDALFLNEADDVDFCFMVDHELFHCAQAKDEFDEPRFNKVTAEPVWAIRGHDIEEFTAVVRRFGIEAAGKDAVDFVLAASKRPEVARAKVVASCGTCLKVAA